MPERENYYLPLLGQIAVDQGEGAALIVTCRAGHQLAAFCRVNQDANSGTPVLFNPRKYKGSVITPLAKGEKATKAKFEQARRTEQMRFKYVGIALAGQGFSSIEQFSYAVAPERDKNFLLSSTKTGVSSEAVKEWNSAKLALVARQKDERSVYEYGVVATLTPDGKALAWACNTCFKVGFSGASRRTGTRKHSGRLKLWHLIAILANMQDGQTETVIGNESSAKKLGESSYNTLSKDGQRKTQQLLDKCSFNVPTPKEYAQWQRYNYVKRGLGGKP